jgi:hypothetical protein
MKRRFLLLFVCLAVMGTTTGVLLSSEKPTKARAVTLIKQKPPRQQRADPPGTSDGAKNPELIPDGVAYGILFRFVANHKGDVGQERIRAYLERTGLSGSDIDAAITLSNEFEERVKILDAQAKTTKDSTWPNPSPTVMGHLAVLQKEKDTLVSETTSQLPRRLTAQGWNALRTHVNSNMKHRIKLHVGPEHPPSGTGWQKGNIHAMH